MLGSAPGWIGVRKSDSPSLKQTSRLNSWMMNNQGSICGESEGVSTTFLTKPEGLIKTGALRNPEGVNPPDKSSTVNNETNNISSEGVPFPPEVEAFPGNTLAFPKAFSPYMGAGAFS